MFSEPGQLTRPPAVAGQFYPDDPLQLASLISDMLSQAKAVKPSHIKALIAPHAGFVYSGPVAASAYASLKQQAAEIERVVLLGPSHRVGFQGLASCRAHEYLMPFGAIPIDRQALQSISHLPQVQTLDKAHAFEHSLEVQLPFLQTVLQDFKLVPLVVGDCPREQVSEVLELLWGGDETLIVISSDLSHYHEYSEAQFLDRKTSEAIVNLRPELIQYDDACGRNPVNGMLVSAKKHHLHCEAVDVRNSGDTAGSMDRVVGYGAYVFSE